MCPHVDSRLGTFCLIIDKLQEMGLGGLENHL